MERVLVLVSIHPGGHDHWGSLSVLRGSVCKCTQMVSGGKARVVGQVCERLQEQGVRNEPGPRSPSGPGVTVAGN